MDKVKEMLYKTLRDDSTATVGLRALLGNTTVSPYNVYLAKLPDNPNFVGGDKFVTYMQLTGEYDTSYPRHNFATVVKQETYQFTSWGGDATTSNDKILDRIKFLLEGKHKTTNPTSDAEVHAIRCEWEGPDLYDDDYEVNYKSIRVRVWLRDDTIANG